MKDDWTDADFARQATQASNAFENLRKQLRRAESTRRQPEAGDVVGRYRIARELGRGGFGSVYEVQHDLLGHRFAMKLLNPRIAADPVWVTRFKEEARTTSLIGHENIVFVTDFGEDERWGSFFVMEFLQGEPLDRIISKEGPLTAERVARFAHAAASAFTAVHEVGIVHCDLKPSNVFSIPRQRQSELWKFLDFGTSTVVMAAVETQALYGTPIYMAPEQSIGLDVSPLSDQFSLTCVMYEMLTGRPPWEVKNWLMATPDLRGRNPPKPPSELSPMCPKAWDDVILRGLALDPGDRWPTLEALSRALGARLDIDWKPAVDPLDLRRSVREERGRMEFAPTITAPRIKVLDQGHAEAPSLVVDVETGESTGGNARIRVEFLSRERFMREVHRNLSVGGLFVPNEDLLSLRETVDVELVFVPGSVECALRAVVVGHEVRRAAGRGFGVAFETRDRQKLDDFISAVRGPTLNAQAVLSRTDEPVPPSLTPGEWFVLSRIDPGTPLKHLRSLCAGLPVDIDDVVTRLLRRKLIRVHDAGEGPSGETSSFAEAGSPRTMESADIEAILERVDFHRDQGNYLGASDVLIRAIEMSPTVAVFHYQLAMLRMEFDGNPRHALPAARRAAELAPEKETYRHLVNSLIHR